MVIIGTAKFINMGQSAGDVVDIFLFNKAREIRGFWVLLSILSGVFLKQGLKLGLKGQVGPLRRSWLSLMRPDWVGPTHPWAP